MAASCRHCQNGLGVVEFRQQKSRRLQLHFEVLKSVPIDAKITHGKSREKKAMHRMLEAGRFYVMDRGYEQFHLFQEIVDKGSSFSAVSGDQLTWQIIQEHPCPGSEGFRRGLRCRGTTGRQESQRRAQATVSRARIDIKKTIKRTTGDLTLVTDKWIWMRN